jgi:hypothetical protein
VDQLQTQRVIISYDIWWAVMDIQKNKINKKKTWDLLEILFSQVGNKLICFDDFNDVVSVEDKIGGNYRTASQLAIGRKLVVDCVV